MREIDESAILDATGITYDDRRPDLLLDGEGMGWVGVGVITDAVGVASLTYA
jgi:hypothetical protein